MLTSVFGWLSHNGAGPVPLDDVLGLMLQSGDEGVAVLP